MDAIEEQARALLISHYSASGFQHGDPLSASDANAVAIKAIAAALTPPEGYVLVPVEPTDEMLLAAHRADTTRAPITSRWSAMLAARPEVP